MNIIWKGAHPNNYQTGRQGNTIKGIVVHWIVGSLESADATFQNPQRIASATYGIGDEEIHQYVKEEDTAYANGNLLSNRTTISIEHEGGPNIPITDATYKTSAQLIADICKRYNIPLNREHIKGHKEVSDKATACPGALDIDRLIREAGFQQEMVTIPLKELDAIRLRRDELHLENQERIRKEGEYQKTISEQQSAINTLNKKIEAMAKAIEIDAVDDYDTGIILKDTQAKLADLQKEADAIAFAHGVAPYSFTELMKKIDEESKPKDKEVDKVLKDYNKLLEWAMESIGKVKWDFGKWIRLGWNLFLRKIGR